MKTCAGSLQEGLSALGQSEFGSTKGVSEALNKAEQTGKSCVELAQDLEFCQAHCRPDLCPAHTAETIIRLNSRLLFREGTDGKEDLLNKLEETDQLLQQRATSCPFLADPELYRLVAEDLSRGISPDTLVDIGIGSEYSPLGGTIAEDLDPEEVLILLP